MLCYAMLGLLYIALFQMNALKRRREILICGPLLIITNDEIHSVVMVTVRQETCHLKGTCLYLNLYLSAFKTVVSKHWT